MIGPCLMARIEESGDLAGEHVRSRGSTRLMGVAERTGKPKATLVGRAAEDLGHDVLNVHRHADDCLGRQAIAAAVTGLFGYHRP